MKRLAQTSVLSLLPLCAVAAPDMQPGMWEITSKMEMSGMEGMPAMPPQTVRQCIKPADVQNGTATVPKGDPACQVKNYKMQGNTASWQMDCNGQNPMTGTGSVTYSGTRYSGQTKFTMQEDGMAMTMKQSFNGKRVGDCK